MLTRNPMKADESKGAGHDGEAIADKVYDAVVAKNGTGAS